MVTNTIHGQTSSSDFVGSYELTMYIEGYQFKGETSITQSNVTGEISTYYGSFTNYTKISYSDYSLSGKIDGEKYTISVSNMYFLIDTETRNSIMNRATMSFLDEVDTYETEYGNFTQQIDSEQLTFTEEYTKRDRENNGMWIQSSIKEISTIESDSESITIKAGKFNATKLKTEEWKDGIYEGYSYSYLAFDGDLLKSES